MGRENEVYAEGAKQGEHSIQEKNLQPTVPAVKREAPKGWGHGTWQARSPKNHSLHLRYHVAGPN